MPTTIAARPHTDAGSGFIDLGDDGPKERGKPNPVCVQMEFEKIAIPALENPFVVETFFSVRAKHRLLAEVDPAFLRIFGKQVIGPREVKKVSRYAVVRDADADRIAGEFAAPITLNCYDVAELLLRSTLRERGFGGLDDSPMQPSGKPRSNIFCLADDKGDEYWIYLFRIRASWHLLMPKDGMIFGEYGKVFVPHGSSLRSHSFR